MIAVNNISGIYVKYGTRKNQRKSGGKSENTEKGKNCFVILKTIHAFMEYRALITHNLMHI